MTSSIRTFLATPIFTCDRMAISLLRKSGGRQAGRRIALSALELDRVAACHFIVQPTKSRKACALQCDVLVTGDGPI